MTKQSYETFFYSFLVICVAIIFVLYATEDIIDWIFDVAIYGVCMGACFCFFLPRRGKYHLLYKAIGTFVFFNLIFFPLLYLSCVKKWPASFYVDDKIENNIKDYAFEEVQYLYGRIPNEDIKLLELVEKSHSPQLEKKITFLDNNLLKVDSFIIRREPMKSKDYNILIFYDTSGIQRHQILNIKPKFDGNINDLSAKKYFLSLYIKKSV